MVTNLSVPWFVAAIMAMCLFICIGAVVQQRHQAPLPTCYEAGAVFQTRHMQQPEVILFDVCLTQKGEQDGGTNSTVSVYIPNHGVPKSTGSGDVYLAPR